MQSRKGEKGGLEAPRPCQKSPGPFRSEASNGHRLKPKGVSASLLQDRGSPRRFLLWLGDSLGSWDRGTPLQPISQVGEPPLLAADRGWSHRWDRLGTLGTLRAQDNERSRFLSREPPCYWPGDGAAWQHVLLLAIIWTFLKKKKTIIFIVPGEAA